MKFAVFALVLAVVLVARADEEKRCGSADDCSEDECCLVRGVLGWKKGDCKKLAQQGETCNQEDAKVQAVHGEYIFYCPCASGLQCEITKVKELPFIGNVTLEQICTSKV